MRDALQSLLRKASAARRTADFWQAAAQVLSDWAGGAPGRSPARPPGLGPRVGPRVRVGPRGDGGTPRGARARAAAGELRGRAGAVAARGSRNGAAAPLYAPELDA